MAQHPTILVFDSGLEGLTVLREIVDARPDARCVYVADDAFFPYGHHSEDALVARVVPLIELKHRKRIVDCLCNCRQHLPVGLRVAIGRARLKTIYPSASKKTL